MKPWELGDKKATCSHHWSKLPLVGQRISKLSLKNLPELETAQTKASGRFEQENRAVKAHKNREVKYNDN